MEQMKQETQKNKIELTDHIKEMHDGLRMKVQEVERLRVIVDTKDTELKTYQSYSWERHSQDTL
jgi:hypothetical protein